MTEQKRDPSAVVVPFGKHKGMTVAELLTRDPQYADWMLAQGWVAERFAELHAAIMNRGAGTDDTPEHNAIQVRFLDEHFRYAFALAADPNALASLREDALLCATEKPRRHLRYAKDRLHELARRFRDLPFPGEEPHQPSPREQAELSGLEEEVRQLEAVISADRPLYFRSRAVFEQRGVDVVVSAAFLLQPAPEAPFRGDPIFTIEIKPTVGDDFPTIMRQMQRLGARHLLVGEYTGRAVSFPDLRRMFQANGQTLVSIQEVEAELANARALIGDAS